MKKKDLVSVIITSKNEEDVIGALLESIVKQTYKNIEIILVDNHSTDNTIKIAKRFNNVDIFNKGPERSAQRNYGASKSKGNYLLFLDSDMVLDGKVVEECMGMITNNEKLGAIVIPEESIGRTFWEKVKGFERSFYNEKGDTLVEAARFFLRDAYKKAGGYDETITGPEDWDLPENVKKLGYEIDRINSKIYHTERIPSLFSLIKKKYYYGLKSSVYLKKNKISPLSPKTIYFLRPALYTNWRKIFSHPILYISMFFYVNLRTVKRRFRIFNRKIFSV